MTTKNLENLRNSLKQKRLSGFLVPRADQWPGEFVSERSERLKWLSEFNGSAGIAIVLESKAVVLTDGRYTIQAQQQVDSKKWETGDSTKVSIVDWLLDHAEQGAQVGFDAKLHSKAEIERWQKTLDKREITLIPLDKNPIDDLWTARPAFPVDKVTIFPDNLAGKSSAGKLKELTDILKEAELEQYFFTMPDSIAWLLNVRGNDVDKTPVPLSFGLLKQDGTFDWYIDPAKVSEDVHEKLGQKIRIVAPDKMESRLKALNSATGLDPKRSSYYFSDILSNSVELEDPCILLKACKNETEQEVIRKTHIADGKALLTFHRWLKDQKPGKYDELKIENKLQAFREQQDGFQGPSFDTIAGYQEHGAIIHYRATQKTSKKVKEGGLLLIDSGGQYLTEDYTGTTDVTRTFLIGEQATAEEKFHYTMVLKAHITVSKARFPYGTTGAQIDALARAVMWEHGLDFAHGLGHGVGCYLNVHEEASHLSPRGDKKLEPGMLLSNEPGLYLEGKYGIRIENLLFVQKTGKQDILGRDMLCFETVTLAPYENDLIDFQLLNGAEMRWLESYYREIEEKLIVE